MIYTTFRLSVLRRSRIGYRCGTMYDGLPRPRTLRRQNRQHARRESRHLGACLSSFTPPPFTNLSTHVLCFYVLMCPQSLGCTLFALAYSHSPFENTQTTEQGGSIAMAVMNGQYKHPQSAYSQGFKDLINAMLTVDPAKRPDIHQVIEMTDKVLQRLS